MLSTRTKLSLIQYLQLFSQDLLSLLFRKHHCEVPYAAHTDNLEDALSKSHPGQVASLLDEIVKNREICDLAYHRDTDMTKGGKT